MRGWARPASYTYTKQEEVKESCCHLGEKHCSCGDKLCNCSEAVRVSELLAAWEEHVNLTRLVCVSALNGLPDSGKMADLLFENQTRLAEITFPKDESNRAA